MVGVAASSLVTSSLPDIVDAFGVDDSAAGLIVGVATVPGVFLAIFVGLAADRWGRKPVLVPSLTLFGIAGFASAFAPTFGWFLVGRGLQGAGAASLLNVTAVVIADHWDGTSRARMIGRNSAAVTVSLAVFPTIGGVLTDTIGWQGPFYAFGLALPLAAAVLLLIPETDLPRAPSVGDQLRQAGRFAMRPRMLMIMAITVGVFVVLFGALLTVAPFHAEEVFGLSASSRGVLLGLPSIFTTIVALFLGRLIGRYGTVRLLVVGSLFYAAAFTVMGAAGLLYLFALGMLSNGIAEGLTIPVLQDATLDGTKPENRGIAASVFGTAARLGQTLGPAVAAPMAAGLGTGSSFFVFAAIAVLLAAGVFTGRGNLRPQPG